MYAVITTGGKQYKVAPGDRIRVNKLQGEVNTDVNFSEVLMLSDGTNVTIGQPKVNGANVEAKILAHGREKKVVIMKFKKRKDYFRKRGFRAHYTKVEIGQIKSK
ncbi:MAG TPA: 50S ribosomal protein L21 [Candidatus Wallbacteria bacterium]|nr:MAG: 50S ribosomal protein L21 [bacterium ADurb.Bin243]HOD38994.1 50S ribosomal protein L21 [Candidatus Wallbacteria bacterium]HPG57523.1 50S ribosomal protein L21 [Candidatus Wallbacteria bacterium]